MKGIQRVIEVIFAAIDNFNPLLPPERQLEKSTDTVLFGKSGKLDSLGLVNLIVEVEQKIEDEFSVSLTIADERALSQKVSPFKTVGYLGDYIAILLEESENE